MMSFRSIATIQRDSRLASNIYLSEIEYKEIQENRNSLSYLEIFFFNFQT